LVTRGKKKGLGKHTVYYLNRGVNKASLNSSNSDHWRLGFKTIWETIGLIGKKGMPNNLIFFQGMLINSFFQTGLKPGFPKGSRGTYFLAQTFFGKKLFQLWEEFTEIIFPLRGSFGPQGSHGLTLLGFCLGYKKGV